VNLVGQIASTEPPSSLSASVSVHRYGKTPRPGRKLGHVTAVADSVDKAVASALHAATELQIGDEKL
jgi:5-(carboxyamino)imidazole ribonucleotide synthase